MFVKGVKYVELCKICDAIRSRKFVIDEDDNYIVYVCERPYNNGHIVVALKEHKSIDDVNEYTICEMFKIVKRCLKVLSEAYTPHGFNIDIIYRPHLAMQVVPRWNGDASFVSVFHNTRVIAEPPQYTLKHIKEVINNLGIKILE